MDDETDDEHDAEVQELMDFFKDSLGEDEFNRIVSGEADDEFDDEEIEQMMKFLNVDMDGASSDTFSAKASDPDMKFDKDAVDAELRSIGLDPQPGAGLKLCGFRFKSGKFYSIVKPFEPFVMVGKYVPPTPGVRPPPGEPQINFDLLTKEEEAIVLPRLKSVAKADLKKAGLNLDALMKRTGADGPTSRKMP